MPNESYGITMDVKIGRLSELKLNFLYGTA